MTSIDITLTRSDADENFPNQSYVKLEVDIEKLLLSDKKYNLSLKDRKKIIAKVTDFYLNHVMLILSPQYVYSMSIKLAKKLAEKYTIKNNRGPVIRLVGGIAWLIMLSLLAIYLLTLASA